MIQRLLAWVRRLLGPPPPPADDAAELARRQAAIKRRLDALKAQADIVRRQL